MDSSNSIVRTQFRELPFPHGAALVCLALLIAGCSDNGLPPMTPVTGTITFNGAPPPAEGAITFLPKEMAAGMGVRPAWAQFGEDGRYEARAFTREPGIVPGRYEVRIDCWKTKPNEATGNPGESYVAKGFQAELIVPDDTDDPIVANYDITKKK